jgi:hypothetical protein
MTFLCVVPAKAGIQAPRQRKHLARTRRDPETQLRFWAPMSDDVRAQRAPA